jgi:hypothetical protein
MYAVQLRVSCGVIHLLSRLRQQALCLRLSRRDSGSFRSCEWLHMLIARGCNRFFVVLAGLSKLLLVLGR